MSAQQVSKKVSPTETSQKEEKKKVAKPEEEKKQKEHRESRESRESRERGREEERRHSDDESEGDESEEDDSEYEELDLTDNPMYQVLSAFFEDEEGHNLCDHIKDLSEAVRENTKMLSKYIKSTDSSRKH